MTAPPTNLVPGLPEADAWAREWIDGQQFLIREEILPACTLGLGLLGIIVSTVYWYDASRIIDATISSERKESAVAWIALSALGVIAGIALYIRRARRIAAVANELPSSVRWLRERPSQIVWIYPIKYELVGRYGSRREEDWLGFGDATGACIRAEVPRGVQREQFLSRLHQLIPHATIGYSDELARRFERDPASFRRR